MITIDKPIYQHDCDNCLFLGCVFDSEYHGRIELYVCISPSGSHSIIGRYGNNPEDNMSFDVYTLRENVPKSHLLQEGLKRFDLYQAIINGKDVVVNRKMEDWRIVSIDAIAEDSDDDDFPVWTWNDQRKICNVEIPEDVTDDELFEIAVDVGIFRDLKHAKNWSDIEEVGDSMYVFNDMADFDKPIYAFIKEF